MLDTSKLSPSLVKDIASNLGWDEGEDIEPYLDRIAQLTPEQALRRFAEWRLGDGEWADIFINRIDQLRRAEEKPDHILATQLLEISRNRPGYSNKIKLIKILRELTDCGLREAKDKVEELFYFDSSREVEPTIKGAYN